jgi:hypothetical protein
LLTIHYINRKFQMRKITITFKSTEDRQSEPEKSALFVLMISKIKCLRPKDKYTRTMVHDIGMNKKASESDAINYQIYCLDQVINNVLKEALAHPLTSPLVHAVDQTAESFHMSVKWCTTLYNKSQKLGINYLRILKPCQTRWNSVCSTVDAICQMASMFMKRLEEGAFDV